MIIKVVFKQACRTQFGRFEKGDQAEVPERYAQFLVGYGDADYLIEDPAETAEAKKPAKKPAKKKTSGRKAARGGSENK